jgi:peptidoglycan/LPS O-acetylase OafA/YrhL
MTARKKRTTHEKSLTGGRAERYIARIAMTADNYIGPRQHLLAMGGLAFGGLVLACLPNAVLGLQYQCVLHWMTGLRCPFCGMTRDFILMAHGSLPRNNPGSLVAALALYVVYPVWLTVTALRGGSRLFVRRDGVVAGLVMAMVLLFVCNNLVS